jgi:hypothetical protein
MRRSKAFKRDRWLSILLAGLIGFLLGNWHAVPSRPTGLSPSQHVALRFPEAKADAAVAVADIAPDAPTSAIATSTIATSAMVLGDAQLALLSPDPMVPPSVRPSATQSPQPPVQAAVPQEATLSPSPAPKVVPAPRPVQPRTELKSAPDGASRHANRPGFLLNDAQIASIKTRLHLTPDQERMWPAVEAALRNVAYAKAREAQRRGPAGSAEVASLNPDSAAVQGLKSAAVPLIMSFSDEQKNEVRSLAHVMGLDKLASEL